MITKNQLLIFSRKNKIKKNKVKSLNNCPQKKGLCISFNIMKPKKPNSARRKIVKIKLSNNIIINAYIIGIGSHNLQKFSTVLIRGGNCIDLPGIKYKVIRGKYDLNYVYDRISSRSKYGKKKS